MKYPPKISNKTIERVISKKFGINIDALEFIPEGESSWIYRCMSSHSEPLIIKIKKEFWRRRSESSSIDVALYQRGFTHVSKPFLSRSRKSWQRHLLHVYSVQEKVLPLAKNGKFEVEDKYLPNLGVILRGLHNLSLPLSVTKSLPKSHLHRYIQKTENLQQQIKAGKFRQFTNINTLMTEYETAIQALLNRTLDYEEKLHIQNQPQTLVHGDLHPFNLAYRTNPQELVIIDWDLAHLSYAEEDLMYFNDKQIELISKGYGRNLLENHIAIEYFRHLLRLREIYHFGYKLGILSDDIPEQKRGYQSLRGVLLRITKEYSNIRPKNL